MVCPLTIKVIIYVTPGPAQILKKVCVPTPVLTKTTSVFLEGDCFEAGSKGQLNHINMDWPIMWLMCSYSIKKGILKMLKKYRK